MLAAAAQLLGRMAQDLQQSPSFPELFRPAAAALDRLAAVSAAHTVRLDLMTWLLHLSLGCCTCCILQCHLKSTCIVTSALPCFADLFPVIHSMPAGLDYKCHALFLAGPR